MKKKNIVFTFILLFLSFSVIDLFTQGYMQMQTPIIVDSIKKDTDSPDRKDWVVRFSKFRSIRWNDVDVVKAEENNTPLQKEDSQSWMYFFQVEEEEDSVLPPSLPDKVKRLDREFLIVKGKFDFRGHNWFIVEPAFTRNASSLNLNFDEQLGKNVPAVDDPNFKKEKPRYQQDPKYIQMDGVTLRINMWVFGVSREYNIQMLIEEHNGEQHLINGGDLNFLGWRKITFDIPDNVIHRQKDLKGEKDKPIKILSFRVSTEPYAEVDKFYFAFDYITADTITSEKYFPGKQTHKKIIDFIED